MRRVILATEHCVQRRHAALLGLIDDVDCAVVSVSWHKNESQEAIVEHLTSIPALAYVATGARFYLGSDANLDPLRLASQEAVRICMPGLLQGRRSGSLCCWGKQGRKWRLSLLRLTDLPSYITLLRAALQMALTR